MAATITLVRVWTLGGSCLERGTGLSISSGTLGTPLLFRQQTQGVVAVRPTLPTGSSWLPMFADHHLLLSLIRQPMAQQGWVRSSWCSLINSSAVRILSISWRTSSTSILILIPITLCDKSRLYNPLLSGGSLCQQSCCGSAT